MNEPRALVSDYIYLDSTNLVQGARHALNNPGWNADFRRLFKFLGGETCRSATLYTANRQFMGATLDAAYVTGFDVVLGRATEKGEKGVDLAMAIDIIEDACADAGPGDRFTLVTGDGDFTPVVERLRQRRMHVDVATWSESLSTSLSLAAHRFVDLTPHRDYLRYDSANYYQQLGTQR